MDNVLIHSGSEAEKKFIPPKYIPEGKDEFYLREIQNAHSPDKWRRLTTGEVEILIHNGNNAENWERILVSDEFDPQRIYNNNFRGLVRIGRLRDIILEHHDLQLPSGIRNSFIWDCDIGDDAVIHNVHYLAHYIIGDRCILANIDEMHTTNYAKFGNGILKDGEAEESRVWLDIMNETGSRQVLPFDGMIPADAYIWAKYRDDTALQKRLKELTQCRFDSQRGYYGTVGQQSVIKTSRILKDVKVGEHCYIKGVNKLKNLTINSSEGEPSQIGEGVELVNGIIGYGCHIFYGCKAVRFILGDNSNLKYGARLINSFLGDNSTISCCEVLNNLIFPAHEQHHNNSFLIASVVMGQSNIAAGATVGSNHNSRANDNEIQAGRGFWPGLCTSLKHSSRFASFVLLAKGQYPAELNIPLPFSLLNNNTTEGRLEIVPAYWWRHNMYALARNTWKFHKRDKRARKLQNIEFDAFAPDSVEEIIEARQLLLQRIGAAALESEGKAAEKTARAGKSEVEERGKAVVSAHSTTPEELKVTGLNMEKSRRPAVILKSVEAYHAYGEMLLYYAVKNLINYLQANPEQDFDGMRNALSGERQTEWVNIGGQLMRSQIFDQLRAEIGSGSLKSWDEIHAEYDRLWEAYPLEKQRHAFAVLQYMYDGHKLSQSSWKDALERCKTIQVYVRDQVYSSRKKDFENPFRQATYRSLEEMTATIGTIEDNTFIQQVREETKLFNQTITKLLKF
ncbi:MAG: DUF4954 family protein [Spirochaetia bacterium]